MKSKTRTAEYFCKKTNLFYRWNVKEKHYTRLLYSLYYETLVEYIVKFKKKTILGLVVDEYRVDKNGRKHYFECELIHLPTELGKEAHEKIASVFHSDIGLCQAMVKELLQ